MNTVVKSGFLTVKAISQVCEMDSVASGSFLNSKEVNIGADLRKYKYCKMGNERAEAKSKC